MTNQEYYKRFAYAGQAQDGKVAEPEWMGRLSVIALSVVESPERTPAATRVYPDRPKRGPHRGHRSLRMAIIRSVMGVPVVVGRPLIRLADSSSSISTHMRCECAP